jgi:hypothetical protein
VLLESFPLINTRYYGDILRGLFPLFGEPEPDDAVRDNAAGAVARMIMAHPQAVPLNQVNIPFRPINILLTSSS